MKPFKYIFLLAAVCSLAFSCKKHCNDDDHCIKIKKNIPLTVAQEVPPKETAAYGTADVSYNKCKRLLTYTISWYHLSGDAVGSHIHGTAPRGVNAPVVYDFTSLITHTNSGSVTDSVHVDNIAIKEDSLLAGFYYFNVHSAKYPGGEIRGQIEF